MTAPDDATTEDLGLTADHTRRSPPDRAMALPPIDPAAERNGAAGGWQHEAWRRLRHRPVRGVIAGVVVGVLAGFPGGAVTAGGPTTYSSQTTVLLDDPLGLATAGDAGLLLKLDELRYKYASLAATDAIAGPVASDLHVPVSVVLNGTSVAVPPNSLLLEVSGTWTTPGLARELSSAMAQGIIQYIHNENTTYAVPAADQIVVSIVDPTSQATASKTPTGRAVAIGGILFVVFGLVGFVAYQLLAAGPARRARR